jgi:type IV pilus assembly protein PilC
MANYRFEVQEETGTVSSGVVSAANLEEATALARSRGGYLLNVSPLATGPADILEKMRSVSVEFGPSLKDIQAFTNQLAVMIKAGINIRSAIASIGEQVENQKFKKIIRTIKDDVESGKPFSDALAKHPKIFSPLYINMVRASELSGNFGRMLERISNYLAQQVETRAMVRGAMVYPGIIAFMAIATTIFLLTFVLPQFGAIFEGKEALLPAPTAFLLATSAFIRTYWYALIVGAVAAAAGFWWVIQTPGGRRAWDITKLKLPLFKKMFRAMYITRGLHTMGELVNAGVPMLETLSITAEVSGNVLYHGMWKNVHDSVKTGNKIAKPLSAQDLMPSNVVQMIAAGEESGNLGEVMRDIAEYYAMELRNTIKSVTAMIEPLMIVIMGVLVGFIAMSIILPIFQMSSLVK